MKKTIVILFSILVLGACSEISNFKSELGNYDGIFSVRPQKQEIHFGMIKLQNPPLLQHLELKKGQKSINTNLAEAIQLEQANLISKLEKISSEIKVIYRYKLVLNAIAIAVPDKHINQVTNLGYGKLIKSGGFSRPINQSKAQVLQSDISEGITSVSFIGADKAHQKGITGKGIKVGIIDTGVDYTHSMLGGPGTHEAFLLVDPNQPSEYFPNQKVVGGYDFVGTNFDAASPIDQNRVPSPDENPIDEAGHGTHVAGTVAGIGDGANSYSGVAPDALIYALKVFGATGSTSDESVIAALEYAVDPNKDLNLSDQLDVVNLSLGGGYGHVHSMYSEAIGNLSNSGTLVVASAGNSGPQDFITGAPAAVDEAFSVAAGIDNMTQNWQFPATKFVFSNGEEFITLGIEGLRTKALAEAEITSGELVYIGLADQDLSEELAAKLKGRVALIDRGVVTFSEKLLRAEEAGAVAAVVANNQEGSPIPMGNDQDRNIPAVMISKDAGDKIKAAMSSGTVQAHLKVSEIITKPELIDSITDFSSKGPRSLDAALKPEITAPGNNIISAYMGTGNEAGPMSGTSMSAPHIAGVMALMKQAYPQMSSSELKAMVMGTSKTLMTQEQKPVPLTLQGAGRVQVAKAVESLIVAQPSALSFGIVALDKSKTLGRSLEIKNISDSPLILSLSFQGHKSVSMAPVQIELPPKSKKTVPIRLKISADSLKNFTTEVDGFVHITSKQNGQNVEIYKVATLIFAQKISALDVTSFTALAETRNDLPGSLVELTLKNNSSNLGYAYLFNMLDLDQRKPLPAGEKVSRVCDLQAAGYRVVNSKIQFTIKLFEPVTNWVHCDLSVLIDIDDNQVAEQELVGTSADSLLGPTAAGFASFLLDAEKARQIRKSFEASLEENPAEIVPPNYTPAIVNMSKMLAFNNSTVAIIEVEQGLLARRPSGKIAIKIATSSNEDGNVQMDDFLHSETEWITIDVTEKAQGFYNMPETIEIPGQAEVKVDFTKGLGPQSLMILAPHNAQTLGTFLDDKQLLYPQLKLVP